MERTSDELRQNNAKVFPIKALLNRFYGDNKRYFYLSGKDLKIPNEVKEGISTEKFFDLLGKHMKGEIRLGVSCELKRDINLITSAVIDIDFKEQSFEEKYDLACRLQKTILSKLGWKSVIEKSKGKGFHIFIFFSNPINRNLVQKQLGKIIEENFKLKIKNGLIELFPKGEGVSVIFLPFFGMLDKEGFIQESFFENKNNCLIKGKPFEAIREIEETIKNAINIVEYNQSKKDVEPQEKIPCIKFAENNWVEGNRQDLAMSLAGICRKKLNITQDEAENLIINIAENNNDNEIPQRKAAIKSTYKIEDINHIRGCSYFDNETICGNCPYLKSQEHQQNREEFTKTDKNGLLSLLKSTSDLRQEEDVKWVVKDLFAKKLVSVIFSEPGVGKTILAMDIAAKLTRGEAIFNHYRVERPMKVLYFQGDFPNTIMKNRLKQMLYNPDDKYFKLVNRYEAESKGISIDLTNEQGQENLKTLLEGYKPDFVIFDTFISFFDGDENKQKDVKESIDFLRKLTSNYDCSILLCHHSRKRGSNEKRKGLDQSDLIGSFVTARLCGLMLAIAHDTEKSTKDEKYNTVICAKTWFKPIESFQFVISNNDNQYIQVIYTTDEVSNTGKNKTQQAKEKIVNVLSSMPEIGFSAKSLKCIAGCSDRTVNNAFSELLADGVIKAIGTTKDRTYFYNIKKPSKKPKEKKYHKEADDLI